MERHWKVAIPVILAVLVATILGACVPAPPGGRGCGSTRGRRTPTGGG
ncbi:hypothetical protein HKBW3S44_00484 [Candidatus Hakubella thermalkaliphila]|uniref:Uncharacterized protein n=2 Tax=Candidatus Hakubella thermalkaliphila TaxID=2754717 RepID=A0A6V8PXE0_9ACTN|nr:hypothetical protein HKBW3S44_00484 [Candidatus Hakubella thermalkaliphila]